MTDADITDRVVLLTGAGGGIGSALGRAFVKAGMRVALTDIHEEPINRLAEELGKDRVMAIPADVSNPKSAAGAVHRALDHFGALHCLVNNAGLGMGVVSDAHFNRILQIEDVSTETFLRVVHVNLCGGFFMAHAAVPIFRAQKWGRIINVTTSLSTMIRPGFTPYGPAKAGFEAWTAGLAGELDGSGITVNVVTPGGATDTPMVPKEAGFDRSSLIRPECMAVPMLYLFSDAAAGVSGRRFIATLWDGSLPPAEAAQRLGAPIAWEELATRAIEPSRSRVAIARGSKQ
jgi:NAD(P)-dependent dehydrogenase (short-subunit alcohol dehydrogenase family)